MIEVFDEYDFVRGLTAEEMESVSDKLVFYLASFKDHNFTDKEKIFIQKCMDRYATDDIVTNPFVFADYHGYVTAGIEFLPELREIIYAEVDLYFALLVFNNPDLEFKEIMTE